MLVIAGYTERPESRAALERAVEEARLRSAELHVVHSVQERPTESPSQIQQWGQKVDRARADGAAFEARMRDLGITARYEVIAASPASAAEHLLGLADRRRAELIVIGLRRRSPVGKLVLGSVSRDVLLGAACPVLAIKARSNG